MIGRISPADEESLLTVNNDLLPVTVGQVAAISDDRFRRSLHARYHLLLPHRTAGYPASPPAGSHLRPLPDPEDRPPAGLSGPSSQPGSSPRTAHRPALAGGRSRCRTQQ